MCVYVLDLIFPLRSDLWALRLVEKVAIFIILARYDARKQQTYQ